MASQIDHLVIVVPDLEAATADFSAAGFTVVPGGQHASGESRNALIAFQDGSYLELFAFLHPEKQTENPWWTRLETGGGFADYALLSNNLAQEIAAIRAEGVSFPDPWDLGRLRPDGQRIDWVLATPYRDGLPFLIQDVTPRSLRAPSSISDQTHKNGATGVSSISVLVQDLDASIREFTAIAGNEALTIEPPFAGIARASRIPIGSNERQWLVLLEPDPGSGNQESLPARDLARFGPGPYAFTVTTASGAEPAPPGAGTLIDPARLGNVRCYLA